MGCDIHVFLEKKTPTGWQQIKIPAGQAVPLEERSYSIFAFLAGVRNYGEVPPIAEPRGVPDDLSPEVKEEMDYCDHTPSWLTVQELFEFDYSTVIEDRRVTRQIGPNFFSGGETCAPGEGKLTTWTEYLGSWFFEELELIRALGADRIVFYFDS